MEFRFDHHNPLKSTYTSTHDGVPLYKVDKHSSHIEIYKFVNGQYVLMTQIELHTFHSDKVSVWGREIKPIDISSWSGSIQFPGFDGFPYKWKQDGSNFRLRNDDSKLEVAWFDHGHEGFFSSSHDKLPILRIHHDGLRILDEIVATFVYMSKKTMDDNNAATTGAIAGAAAA
ncbi:hypothetical protein K435DRAFT_798914 [Dendrothele bispora CBS 962.96]|uniref:DUF6593 domain-containing protein n=1 Tax=Dendrothele bispora (strain CBS 962.96) TaxID=1314807 RepID=A0A4S8LYU4_DENBC|nr:hypothetical protein K435DRAFT_798914 [Dendrothele bispora CBS 962.96]